MTVTSAQRQFVVERAGKCCEYCRVAETDETSPFHLDHIVPLKHHGTDDVNNLCLACYSCNAFKGSNMAAADPVTGIATFLFHPRNQVWDDHFLMNSDSTLSGLTPEGRVTIEVLRINDKARVQYRQAAARLGEYPCQRER